MNKHALANSYRGAGYWIGLIGGFLFLAAQAQSQTNSPKYGTISSRFLLIVETSRAMGHRSDATLKTVASLLYSGFSRQIKQGDTLGVWTYNEQLYAGRMPLRRWSSPLQHEIVGDTLNFLKAQKYEKEPTFSSLRPALDKVIKDSELITVVLISSGEGAISGTPFDDKINELYKNWKGDQEKERMPFITILRAKHGTIVGYVAVPVPWQAEIPPWPAETNAAPTVVASLTPIAQTSAIPALVFTGKKPKPAGSTKSSEIAPIRESAPAAASPAPAPAADGPAEPRASEPSHVVPETLPIAPTPKTTVIEQKVQPSETPQHPAEPAAIVANTAVASDTTPKVETVLPLVATVSNSSNAAPAETVEKSTRDISTAAAIPRNGPLSGKMIWLAGLAVLGIVCAILFALTRRPTDEHISLITRSLERETK